MTLNDSAERFLPRHNRHSYINQKTRLFGHSRTLTRSCTTDFPVKMAPRKSAGENSKKAAGQARKAEAAAAKQAEKDRQKAAVEDAKWQQGAKSNAKA